MGCNIGHIFCGAMGYADDIILLAPTKSSLLKMLDIAETTAKIYDIIFNASKCKYMIFGMVADNINSFISFNNIEIQRSMSEPHLGNLLYWDNREKAINEAINMMYFRLNSLLSKFNFANIFTKYHLFKTYYMTIYGGQLWDYDGKHIKNCIPPGENVAAVF